MNDISPVQVVLRLGTVAWAAAMLIGCGPSKPPEVHPIWPGPPEPPRIGHVRNVRDETDLGQPNVLTGLGNLLTGGKRMPLMRPVDVAVDDDKRLYVVDQERQALFAFDMKTTGSKLIEQAGKTFFVSPVGVEVCDGDVVVSDSALNRVFVLSPEGKLLREITKPGGFRRPTGLAYDKANKLLYVVDTLANEVCVFDYAGGKLRRRLGSHGEGPGEFNYPTHLCLGPGGKKVYVTDSLNFRVQVLDAKTGKYLGHIGRLGDATGHLAVPKGVGINSHGHIYIVDSYFGSVQIFDQKGRLLLPVGRSGSGPGQFQVPTGLTIDSHDRVYVCDTYNARVQILEYLGGADEATTQPSPK